MFPPETFILFVKEYRKLFIPIPIVKAMLCRESDVRPPRPMTKPASQSLRRMAAKQLGKRAQKSLAVHNSQTAICSQFPGLRELPPAALYAIMPQGGEQQAA